MSGKNGFWDVRLFRKVHSQQQKRSLKSIGMPKEWAPREKIINCDLLSGPVAVGCFFQFIFEQTVTIWWPGLQQSAASTGSVQTPHLSQLSESKHSGTVVTLAVLVFCFDKKMYRCNIDWRCCDRHRHVWILTKNVILSHVFSHLFVIYIVIFFPTGVTVNDRNGLNASSKVCPKIMGAQQRHSWSVLWIHSRSCNL